MEGTLGGILVKEMEPHPIAKRILPIHSVYSRLNFNYVSKWRMEYGTKEGIFC